MLKVFRVHNDEYIVTTRDDAFYGSLIKTIEKLFHMGVSESEIELGLLSLQANDHHVAEYGVFKCFMYSKRVTE